MYIQLYIYNYIYTSNKTLHYTALIDKQQVAPRRRHNIALSINMTLCYKYSDSMKATRRYSIEITPHWPWTHNNTLGKEQSTNHKQNKATPHQSMNTTPHYTALMHGHRARIYGRNSALLNKFTNH